MKKNTKMALLPAGMLLVLGLVVSLSFQNCGNVKFQTTAASAASVLTVTAKSCIDQNGVERKNSETWNIVVDSQQVVKCADSTDQQQGYEDTTSYICDDGTISTTASDTKLIAPNSTCPAPVLTATANPTSVANGGSSNLVVNSQAVHNVAYQCKSVANGSSMFSGNLAVGAVTKAVSPIVEDLTCDVTAQTSTTSIKKTVDIGLDCESSGKIKDPTTHTCVEFQCKTFVEIKPTTGTNSLGFIDVPARTSAGICYSVKLMNAIANSSSDLSSSHDTDVVSAHHGGSGNWNPWVLGKANLEFIMRAGGGARQVKLSGASALAPIKVDNFVISGLAKKTVGLASNNAYRSYGTIDSAVDGNGKYLMFRNQQLPIASFGPGGTATIAALDLTTQVSTEENYLLDLRALDCGGARELSDIYLLFQ